MPAKRYGDGSVYQRASDGLWVATYQFQGKRRQAYGKTEQEALRKRRSALKRIAEGRTATQTRLTFADAADRWTTNFSRTLGISEASRKNYVDVLRIHVIPTIGRMKLESIKPSDISAVMATMADKGYSPSYRHQAHKAMSHVFKMAIADEIVTANPVRSPTPQGERQRDLLR